MSGSPTGTRQFRNEVVRISELTVTTFVLEGLEFSNCRILGPAVLVSLGNTDMIRCNWDAPDLESIFWEISPARKAVVGAVAVRDCTFSSCSFSLIGLAGPPEMRAAFEGALS